MIPTLIFYLFASLALLGGAMVIFARNPVHAVLFLVFTFFNVGGLFVLLGAEFIAMLLVIVYVGAVAVLFLFVVMMLNVNFEAVKRSFVSYVPLAAFILVVLCAEFLSLFLNLDGLEDSIQSGGSGQRLSENNWHPRRHGARFWSKGYRRARPGGRDLQPKRANCT